MGLKCCFEGERRGAVSVSKKTSFSSLSFLNYAFIFFLGLFQMESYGSSLMRLKNVPHNIYVIINEQGNIALQV